MFKKHAFLWLIVTALIISYSVFFNDNVIVKQAEKEQEMIRSSMGDETYARIIERTTNVYSVCCNWLASLTKSIFVSKYKDSEGVQDAMIKSHQGFWTSIYVFIERIFVFGEWLIVFWVIFIAAFNHGLVRRTISVTNVAWSSPIRYHLGLHYAVAVMGISVNYLFFPWAVHPYIAILFLTVFSIVLYVIASNIQQKV